MAETDEAEKTWQTRHWAYEPLTAWLNEGHDHRGGGKSWVHCDQLTLHRPGLCRYCDQYGADAQSARIARGVPFSGEAGAPDAIFRPDETITRWGGNRAYPPPTAYPAPAATQIFFDGRYFTTVPDRPYVTWRATRVAELSDAERAKHEPGCCLRNGCHPVCSHFCKFGGSAE